MLDENLPSFLIRPSGENELSNTVSYSAQGSEPEPQYILWKPDPRTPGAQNRYAVALRDPYNPDVVYGEVVVEPEWTQPTLSAAEMRALNGAPGAPTPVIPNSFAIQLYNPDQHIIVKQVGKTLGGSWEFKLPKNTFRLPSASTLDRSLDDPGSSAITPKLTFYWKKDSLISLASTPHLTCYMSGKSSTETGNKRSREVDITVAMFRNGKRLTIYEPNLSRVDVEDKKGLELVTILGAQAIKDLYLNQNSKDLFNLSNPAIGRKNSTHLIGPGRKNSGGAGLPPRQNTNPVTPASQALHSSGRAHANSRPPATDLRTQFVLDAETKALRAAIEAEEARERKARERQAQEDARAVRKMIETEERERMRHQAEEEKETERLRRQYGIQGASGGAQPSPYHQAQLSNSTAQFQRPMTNPVFPPPPTQPAPQFGGFINNLNMIFSPMPRQPYPGPPGRPRTNGSASRPYLQAPGSSFNLASASSFFNSGNRDQSKMAKKRSVHF